MKKNKIFILAFIALILAFSCFTGFVSAPSVMAQPFDDLFPPQSSDYYYFYFDFSSCGISSGMLDNSFSTFTFWVYDSIYDGTRDGFEIFSFSDLPSFSLVYQLSLPKNYIISNDVTDITISFAFPDFTGYGIPSIDNVLFLDNQEITFEPTYTLGSNFIQFSLIPSDMSALIFTFSNTELAFKTQYNSLRDQYNTLDTLYTTLQGDYNTLNSQFTTLQGQYNTLNTQYATLQSDYNMLDTQYQLSQAELEEALELAETYQRDLREATAQNERLQELVNNLPPTDLAFGWVGTAFATMDSILSIEIVPNVSIGSLVLIPLILGVLFFVLRLVRGE